LDSGFRLLKPRGQGSGGLNFGIITFRVKNVYSKIVIPLQQAIKLAKETPIAYNNQICFGKSKTFNPGSRLIYTTGLTFLALETLTDH
jgi:hypothetical protein